AGHFFDLLSKIDEGLVFDARAAGAGDDVERGQAVVDHAADAAGGNVGQDLTAGGDLFGLAVVGNSQGNADRVADAAADKLLEGDAGFDNAVRRQAGFGDAQMQRDVGAVVGEATIDFDDLRRVTVLE